MWCTVRERLTDGSERAKLWDIQDQQIEARGETAVDVLFRGRARETPIPASIKVDVSDVARNFASMGRLLRVGFDSHLTNFGHTCWMQNGRQQTPIKEDSPTSEAPLHSLDVEVLPLGEDKSTVGARVAPIAAAECEQLEEGSKVEMAGLVQDLGLNGQNGICLGLT